MTPRFRKLFTPQEANHRLPLIKKIVTDILEKGQTLQAKVTTLKAGQPSAECVALEEEIENLMKELENLGCFYKDWNFTVGLIDFPAVIHGQEVFLCWRSDESFLRWYHGIEEGFTGRKLIPENLLD